MTALEQLLEVQGHDTAADQLRHRRASLAERARRAEIAARLEQLRAAAAAAEERRTVLHRSQLRLEDDVAGVEAKAAHTNQVLYGGVVTNPRELQGFQDELRALKRRQQHLEDQVLDVMEQVEPVDVEREHLAGQVAEFTAELERLDQVITAAEAELDAALGAATAARAQSVAGLPAGLLAEYEALRARHGGIGVARLKGTRCDGCNLSLSAVEVSRLRKLDPDAVVHCDECGRLLVR